MDGRKDGKINKTKPAYFGCYILERGQIYGIYGTILKLLDNILGLLSARLVRMCKNLWRGCLGGNMGEVGVCEDTLGQESKLLPVGQSSLFVSEVVFEPSDT